MNVIKVRVIDDADINEISVVDRGEQNDATIDIVKNSKPHQEWLHKFKKILKRSDDDPNPNDGDSTMEKEEFEKLSSELQKKSDRATALAGLTEEVKTYVAANFDKNSKTYEKELDEFLSKSYDDQLEIVKASKEEDDDENIEKTSDKDEDKIEKMFSKLTKSMDKKFESIEKNQKELGDKLAKNEALSKASDKFAGLDGSDESKAGLAVLLQKARDEGVEGVDDIEDMISKSSGKVTQPQSKFMFAKGQRGGDELIEKAKAERDPMAKLQKNAKEILEKAISEGREMTEDKAFELAKKASPELYEQAVLAGIDG